MGVSTHLARDVFSLSLSLSPSLSLSLYASLCLSLTFLSPYVYIYIYTHTHTFISATSSACRASGYEFEGLSVGVSRFRASNHRGLNFMLLSRRLINNSCTWVYMVDDTSIASPIIRNIPV